MSASSSAKAPVRRERPLSPHLQIYWQGLTGNMSISHRITGVALAIGTLLLVCWLIAAASGPQAFAGLQNFMGSWIGLLLLFGWSASLFYHLANGIRHLFWDVGLGFDLKTAYASGWVVLAATAALTLIAWGVAFGMRGGM